MRSEASQTVFFEVMDIKHHFVHSICHPLSSLKLTKECDLEHTAARFDWEVNVPLGGILLT